MGFPWRHPPVGGQHSTLRRTQEAGPPHSGRPTIGCVHGGDTLPRRGRALARGSGSVGDPRVRCSSADASGQGSGRPGPRTGTPKGVGVVRDALTLRQTCPQPRPRAQFAFKDSMIHGQCRSHYVSHFAAFFIVARAKISVVESCLGSCRRASGGERELALTTQTQSPVCFRLGSPPRCFGCVVCVLVTAEPPLPGAPVRFAGGSDVRY